MSLDDKTIHVKVNVDDASVIIKNIEEIPKRVFNIATAFGEAPNEIPTIHLDFESLLNTNYLLTFDEYLVPSDSAPTSYSSIKTYLILDIDVAGDIDSSIKSSSFSADFVAAITTQGKRLTHGAISASFVNSRTVQGYRTTKSNIIAPFNISIVTAGVASSPIVPQFKAVGSVSSFAAPNACVPSLPAGWAPGDFAICIGYADLRSGNSLATTGINGWISIGDFEGTPAGLRVWYRFLQAGDGVPTVYMAGSGSWNSTDCVAAVIATFENVNSGTPLDGGFASDNGYGSPASTAAITTTQANSLLLTLLGRGDNEAFSSETYNGSATGVSELFDLPATGGDDGELAAFAKILASAGSSGAASASTSGTDPWVALTLALRGP